MIIVLLIIFIISVCSSLCSGDVKTKISFSTEYFNQPNRSIVFDTETTGFRKCDRIVEIAALELIDNIPTGKYFHTYINPQRSVPADATRIHGLTRKFLNDKPVFVDILSNLLTFFADSPLIAHNASFDFKFLNKELELIGGTPLDSSRMVDSLAMARARFPGMKNNLDALCKRFNINLSERSKHGALIDCKLLARVYLELLGKQKLSSVAPVDSSNSPLYNKKLVFTGSLDRFPRSKAKELAESFGAKVIETISKNTDYLVVGIKPGVKLKKASELGIKILNEVEFLDLIQLTDCKIIWESYPAKI